MSRSASADEVEQEHLQVFGPSLGPIYHRLYDDVLWLHAKWQEFIKLYGSSEQRIDVMNATAPYLFRMMQDVLWHDVILHIARLTDPARQGAFENLTLRCLPPLIPDAVLANEVSDLLRQADAKCDFVREWRNKRLAHADLSTALRSGTVKLRGVNRRHIDEALDSLARVIQCIHVAYLKSDLTFEVLIQGGGDATELVYHLWRAKRFEEQRQARFLQGNLSSDEFEQPPAL